MFIADIDFKLLPRSADGTQQYLVYKKDLDLYFINMMDLKHKERPVKFKKLNKLELDKGQIG